MDSGSEGFEWSSEEVESIEDPTDVVDRGVSIEVLVDLLIEHDLEHLTTREVVDSFVLPQTADYQCSLAGLMKRSFPMAVGNATHYVVHPWDGSFGRLVRALMTVDSAFQEEGASDSSVDGTDEDEDEDGDGDGLGEDSVTSSKVSGKENGEKRKAFFWIDVFAIDQHEHLEGYEQEDAWLHRDELFRNVRRCIETIDFTCLFLDPCHKPVLLQRSWCLYECMQALSNGRELILASCPEPGEARRMKEAIEDFGSAIEAFRPDFAKSVASSEEDREWLVHAVSAAHPSGAAWLNEQVGRVMLHWLAQEVLSDMYSYHQHRLANSSLQNGMRGSSRSLTSSTRPPGISEGGEGSTSLLEMKRKLSWNPSSSTGVSKSLTDAQVLSRSIFIPRKESAELKNDDVGFEGSVMSRSSPAMLPRELLDSQWAPVDSIHALGSLLESLSCVDDAHLQYKRALDIAHDMLGQEHSVTLHISHDLACLQAKHFFAFQEAEARLNWTLEEREERLGMYHNDTIETIVALARLLQAQNRIDEAEALFRRAVQNSIVKNGFEHRQSLVSANLLALLLQGKGHLFEARILLARTHVVGIAVLGRHHADVLVWRNNLAVLLQDLGELEMAESVFRKALTDCEQALGPEHQQTLNIVFNLGQCLWQQGKLRAAETLFRRELRSCRQIYGDHQHDTIRSIRNMIEFFASQGQGESEEMHQLKQLLQSVDEEDDDEA